MSAVYIYTHRVSSAGIGENSPSGSALSSLPCRLLYRKEHAHNIYHWLYTSTDNTASSGLYIDHAFHASYYTLIKELENDELYSQFSEAGQSHE